MIIDIYLTDNYILTNRFIPLFYSSARNSINSTRQYCCVTSILFSYLLNISILVNRINSQYPILYIHVSRILMHIVLYSFIYQLNDTIECKVLIVV